jgi:hypothetical protein
MLTIYFVQRIVMKVKVMMMVSPTQGMDVCVCVYSVFMLSSVGSGLATG